MTWGPQARKGVNKCDLDHVRPDDRCLRCGAVGKYTVLLVWRAWFGDGEAVAWLTVCPCGRVRRQTAKV